MAPQARVLACGPTYQTVSVDPNLLSLFNRKERKESAKFTKGSLLASLAVKKLDLLSLY